MRKQNFTSFISSVQEKDDDWKIIENFTCIETN
jgi:hypothetical protein